MMVCLCVLPLDKLLRNDDALSNVSAFFTPMCSLGIGLCQWRHSTQNTQRRSQKEVRGNKKKKKKRSGYVTQCRQCVQKGRRAKPKHRDTQNQLQHTKKQLCLRKVMQEPRRLWRNQRQTREKRERRERREYGETGGVGAAYK